MSNDPKSISIYIRASSFLVTEYIKCQFSYINTYKDEISGLADPLLPDQCLSSMVVLQNQWDKALTLPQHNNIKASTVRTIK